MGKKGRLSDKYKLVVIEYSQDGKYRIWNIVNNNVVTMYGVRWIQDLSGW